MCSRVREQSSGCLASAAPRTIAWRQRAKALPQEQLAKLRWFSLRKLYGWSVQNVSRTKAYFAVWEAVPLERQQTVGPAALEQARIRRMRGGRTLRTLVTPCWGPSVCVRAACGTCACGRSRLRRLGSLLQRVPLAGHARSAVLTTASARQAAPIFPPSSLLRLSRAP